MPYKKLLLAYCRHQLLETDNWMIILQDSLFLHPREMAYNILKIALQTIKEEHGIECF